MADILTVSGSTRRLPLPRWVRVINGISLALVSIGAVACVLMMLHVIVDVSGRTLWNQPLAGTLEITEHWWMTTIVFGSLGYTQLRGENIRATPVTDLLPDNWQRGAEVGAVALLGLLAAAMGYYGWNAALESFGLREAARVGDTVIPIWPVSILVPIGSASLFLQCIVSAYELATRLSPVSRSQELV